MRLAPVELSRTQRSLELQLQERPGPALWPELAGSGALGWAVTLDSLPPGTEREQGHTKSRNPRPLPPSYVTGKEVVSTGGEHPDEGQAGDGNACDRASCLCRPSLGPAHVKVPLGHCTWPLTSGRFLWDNSRASLGPGAGKKPGAPSPGTLIFTLAACSHPLASWAGRQCEEGAHAHPLA